MNVDPSTSLSLLLRLQDPKNPKSQEDWNRFVTLYTPLLVMWSRNRKLQEADVSDLVQTIFVKIYSALPRMTIDPSKRFRGYLFTTMVNAFRDFCSKQKRVPISGIALDEAVANAKSDVQFLEDQWFREYTLAQAFITMEKVLNAKELKICEQLFRTDKKPSQIARELGIPIHQVYTAKSRGMKKILEEFRDFWE